MKALSDRALLTVGWTGFLGFATLFLREVVYLTGLGALNGGLEGGRRFIGGHGTYREVPRWFCNLLGMNWPRSCDSGGHDRLADTISAAQAARRTYSLALNRRTAPRPGLAPAAGRATLT